MRTAGPRVVTGMSGGVSVAISTRERERWTDVSKGIRSWIGDSVVEIISK